ncbi:MAG: hypothetical protein O3A21_01675 [Proteobacteria bacterium]|nr:hypothetical protein [Pseudomonadota bacterium]
MTTTETFPDTPTPTLLRTALLANAGFSAASGLALAVASTSLSDLIGINAPFVLALLGIALLLYAVVLFVSARRRVINRGLAWAAIAMDDAWVVGSIALLVVPGWFTPFGVWLVGIVAAIVTGFAIAQFLGVRNTNQP